MSRKDKTFVKVKTVQVRNYFAYKLKGEKSCTHVNIEK